MLLEEVLWCLLLFHGRFCRSWSLWLAFQFIEVVAHRLLLFKHVAVHHIELLLVWLTNFAR